MSDAELPPPAPESPPEPGPGAQYPLAARVQRLAAVLIDMLINTALMQPLLFFWNLPDYVESGAQVPAGLLVQVAVAGFVIFILVNGWLLVKYGQTIGKRILKIAIVDERGNLVPLQRLIALRYAPFWAVANFVPWGILSVVLDSMFIYRDDRRCLHDWLAGTRVIDVSGARGEE